MKKNTDITLPAFLGTLFRVSAMLLLSVFITINAAAQIRLPSIIMDSMVLQRGEPIQIWGQASAHEKITIRFNGRRFTTKAGEQGDWAISMPAIQAGGPFEMEITGRNKIRLRNILVGDVWLVSGQSNMEHQLKLHAVRYRQEIREADFLAIRQFKVPNVAALQGPSTSMNEASWKPADPVNVMDFSAVAYFMAVDLHKKYGVPIGIINASWGGSPIEAWMGENALRPFPHILETVERNKDSSYTGKLLRQVVARQAEVNQENDAGINENPPWYSPDYIPKGWRNIGVPGYWEDQGIRDLDGTVWYRKNINIPESMARQNATAFLGRIVDADRLFINGHQVGETHYLYPQRIYPVLAGLLKPGLNTITVKIRNYAGKGGFVPDKPYYLATETDTVLLSGAWQYKVGEIYPASYKTPQVNFTPAFQPTALFNTMISPITRYRIKGIAWYQGESNSGRAAEYAKLQPALIKDWRQQWKNESLPFVFVQLPGFMEMNYHPGESGWADFREAQQKSLALPRTAMATAIDLGEWNDVHPDRKKEVGQRLALAAGAAAYGDRQTVFSGPVYEKAEVSGNRVILHFSHTGSGLMSLDGETLRHFAIAGAEKKWVWAHAKIEGNTVVVSSPLITEPRYVRYAWADNPDGVNLYNREGLPAAPFRTDD